MLRAFAVFALMGVFLLVPASAARADDPVLVRLPRCTHLLGGTQTVPAGSLVRLRLLWFAKTRGLVEDFIQGSTVRVEVNGAPVEDASRYWTRPEELSGGWISFWLYDVPGPIVSATVVTWSEELDHQLIDLVVFNADGTPTHYEAGPLDGGVCAITPG